MLTSFWPNASFFFRKVRYFSSPIEALKVGYSGFSCSTTRFLPYFSSGWALLEEDLVNGKGFLLSFWNLGSSLCYLCVFFNEWKSISWVKQKKCKTKLSRTAETEALFVLIERAEKWLKENKYTTPILKWETREWGEIPADFGRK